MPESVSGVDAILDGLRDRSHLEDCGEHGLERVVYIEQATWLEAMREGTT